MADNNSSIKVSAAALALVLLIAGWFIKPWEGERHTGYADIVGVATACVGHTGPGVEVGKQYTQAQCDEWLAQDLGTAARGVDACINVPMKSHEWAAFTSLAFNIGVAQFCRSSIARFANYGMMADACQAIGRYVYAGGRKVLGLERRRAAEIALCQGKV